MIRHAILLSISLGLVTFVTGCSKPDDSTNASPNDSSAEAAAGPVYDVLIKNGVLFDGSGDAASVGHLGINGDRIAAMLAPENATGRVEIDASGLAVAPGFINMLSWATESLIIDGRSMGDIIQGVTLEVFGEGNSMGPVNDTLKEILKNRQGDYEYDIEWTTLGEYLEYLEAKGVSTNVASFIGATTARTHVLGFEDRAPNAEELDTMRGLVKVAMEEGAMGVGSSLIYPPAFYASTDELIALCEVASSFGGMYISHMRSEGNTFLEALDELIAIARTAELPAEVYHLKAAGTANWPKMDDALAKIEGARAEGLKITADMYTYVAGSTGLDATFPPWVAEGGRAAMEQRLRDPDTRDRVLAEMNSDSDDWENMLRLVGTPENILLVGFQKEHLKPLIGKTLQEVSTMRETSPANTAIDLVLEDETRVGTVYFMMSEDNVKKQMKYPWVSFGSDGASMAPEGVFLKSSTHPRAYGNFVRVLGKYVREDRVLSLEEAIRRLTALPASNLKLRDRGQLLEGFYADVVVFDPNTVSDHATFAEPHQLSTGMTHVFVNGEHVIENGEHTGATPGRVVRGPGWTGWQN